jgi:diguanylate cyclase (GGDEF)-like protein
MRTFSQRYVVPVATILAVGAALTFVSPFLGVPVTIVGSLGMIFLLARQDTAALTQMRIAVEKLESGIVPDLPNLKRIDEIGTLAAAINRLGKTDKSAQQANTDPLTGLANRRGMLQKMDSAFKRQQPFALMYIDLDKFKPVNDTYGHEAGDAVLRKVAEMFRACVRDEDTVARLGGDEFTIILYGLTEKDQVEERAKRIMELINEPIWLNDLRIKLGASIGITIAPHDGGTVEAIIQAADETMYAVKKSGRNNYRFYS